MADGVTVKVRRKDRLFKKLRRTVPAVEQEMENAGRKSADEMVTLAQRFVPEVSGRLKRSIRKTGPGDVPPAFAQGLGGPVPPGAFMVTAGDSSVRYPHLVEFGTPPHTAGGIFEGALHPGAPAQPYFFPAFRIVRRKHRGRVTRAFSKALKNSVRT